MPKIAISIIMCMIASTLLIVILFGFSKRSDESIKGGFVRSIVPSVISNKKEINIKFNSYYIAGSIDNKVYLGNYTSPTHILILTNNETKIDSQSIRISPKDTVNKKITNFARLKVTAPYFYIIDGTVPILFKGRINEWIATRYLDQSVFFNDAVPFSPTSIAIKAITANPKENVIGIKNASLKRAKINATILKKQIDGLFCTAGDLQYNEKHNKLIYTYQYRNEYLTIDTSLTLISTSHTIDTNSVAKLQPIDIKSNGDHTLSSPAAAINRWTSTSGDWLFINSSAMSDNESIKEFSNSSVIDVYDLRTNTYKLSFYLPDYNKKKIKEIIVLDNNIAVLYDRYAAIFKLNKEVLSTYPKKIQKN